MANADDKVSGIGGWLILPAIGLALAPLMQLYQFFKETLPAFDPQVWHALTDAASNFYDRMWGPAILFETATNVVLFGYTLWLAYLFFLRKSVWVPRLFIVLLGGKVFIDLVDAMLVASIHMTGLHGHGLLAGLAPPASAALIWIPYFMRSRRVKNTFIHPAGA